jgi:hypothetical protein
MGSGKKKGVVGGYKMAAATIMRGQPTTAAFDVSIKMGCYRMRMGFT